MANVKKILGITALIGILVAVSYKGASFYKKLKQASGNIMFDVSFLRIYGLVGEGITKFISPTVRVLFNLELKNFSGLNIEITDIFARIDFSKNGGKDWASVASAINRLTINSKDGSQINKELTFDFKGISTITSLINKTNKHRIVLTYNLKGQQLQFIKEIDISGPLSAFWKKQSGGSLIV